MITRNNYVKNILQCEPSTSPSLDHGAIPAPKLETRVLKKSNIIDTVAVLLLVLHLQNLHYTVSTVMV